MSGASFPYLRADPDGRRWTLLDCELGNHTGVFQISRVDYFGRNVWSCDACINEKGAQR